MGSTTESWKALEVGRGRLTHKQVRESAACQFKTFLTEFKLSSWPRGPILSLSLLNSRDPWFCLPYKNKCRPILVQGLRRDITINFHINNIYGSVAQSVEWWPVEQEIRGSITASCNIFLNDISFIWGNEPNGEQEQQEEQQLKKFLGLWPMAADKNNWLLAAGIEPLPLGQLSWHQT